VGGGKGFLDINRGGKKKKPSKKNLPHGRVSFLEKKKKKCRQKKKRWSERGVTGQSLREGKSCREKKGGGPEEITWRKTLEERQQSQPNTKKKTEGRKREGEGLTAKENPEKEKKKGNHTRTRFREKGKKKERRVGRGKGRIAENRGDKPFTGGGE